MYKPVPKTPLQRAAEDDDLPQVKKLLAEGVDVNAPVESESLTPLMWAIMHKNQKMVEALLEKSPDLEMKDNNGWTALMYATRANELKMTKMLLEAGADIDARDKSGLHAASPNSGMTNLDIPVMLLEYAEKRRAAAQNADACKAGEACHEGLRDKISVAKPLQIKPK